MEANTEREKKGAVLSASPTPKVLVVRAATEKNETVIGMEDTRRTNISQHDSLNLQDEQYPSPSSHSSNISSPPTSYSFPGSFLTVSPPLNDGINIEDLAAPSAPPTPRTQRFLDDFRALLALLPAQRYSVSPSSPALSTYSMAAVSVSACTDYDGEDVEMNIDVDAEDSSSVDNRGRSSGGVNEVTGVEKKSRKRKRLHTY
ncbi:hypothetical protein GGS26DRAFT_588474 [Hypomontagnella submonticulosa]|nr:hypothetical protein GGS26DRAFT_588474 [Hypomontagnella submonticulosa]